MSGLKEFKIRCSAIGKIMANGRGKDAGMGKTAQSYCDEWIKEQLYDRRNEFSNKYTEKGIKCEDDSIQFATDHFDWGMAFKNEKHFSNDFMTGTPDIILGDSVEDIKNSWDCFTFPLFDDSITNKDYMYQLQGYMALTRKKKAGLVYTLMDAPLSIIEKQARIAGYNTEDGELSEDEYDAIEKNMTYSNMPDNLRIKRFEIEYDQTVIDAIEKRVLECREYIKQRLINAGLSDLI